jgi:hypothetical protein
MIYENFNALFAYLPLASNMLVHFFEALKVQFRQVLVFQIVSRLVDNILKQKFQKVLILILLDTFYYFRPKLEFYLVVVSFESTFIEILVKHVVPLHFLSSILFHFIINLLLRF